MTQDIKFNINKIDYDLKGLFENVYISEKSLGNQFYFEISANSTFLNLNELKAWQRAEVKVKISKRDLISNNVKWSYSVNPLNESADIIERVSPIGSIAKDIYEVITKSKMEKSYFESLEYIVESINENTTEVVEKTIEDKLSDCISEFGIKVDRVENSVKIIEGNQFERTKDITYKFYHTGDIKLSDMFKIEQNINLNGGVNWTLFKEGFIEVNYSC